MYMHKALWSNEEEQDLLVSYVSGSVSLEALARRHERSITSIIVRLEHCAIDVHADIEARDMASDHWSNECHDIETFHIPS